MFAQYDEDGDEKICVTEFTLMFGDYVGTHEGIADEAVEMHMQYDLDGDEGLDRTEFKALYEDQVTKFHLCEHILGNVQKEWLK